MKNARSVLNVLLLVLITQLPKSTFSEEGELKYPILGEFRHNETSFTKTKRDKVKVSCNKVNADNPLLSFGIFFTFAKGI